MWRNFQGTGLRCDVFFNVQGCRHDVFSQGTGFCNVVISWDHRGLIFNHRKGWDLSTSRDIWTARTNVCCGWFSTPCGPISTPCGCFFNPCGWFSTHGADFQPMWLIFNSLWLFFNPCGWFSIPCGWSPTPLVFKLQPPVVNFWQYFILISTMFATFNPSTSLWKAGPIQLKQAREVGLIKIDLL